MAVKIKNATVKDEKGKPINFDTESYMAVKGANNSFFSGKVKVVHIEQGKKLVKRKLATKVEATLIKEKNLNRVSTDKPTS